MKRLFKWLRYMYTSALKMAKTLLAGSRNLIRYIHKKKRFAIPLYFLLAFGLYITLLIQFSGDPSYAKELDNKYLNDVTQLNPIQVGRIIRPKTIFEITQAIRTSTGPISIGGGKYSMGGQTAFENSLHIDMRSFNKLVHLDTVTKQVTVQAGMRWRDLQEKVDPYNLSIKIMQTYSNFTVGGAISVNCHGRYIGHGPIISSVLALKIVTASGETIKADRETNREVFDAAVGGYGGIGVIVEATLQLADNVKVERHDELMPIRDYATYFQKNIRNNTNIIFQNGDLYPPNYTEIRSVSWEKTTKTLTDTDRLNAVDENYWLETKLETLVSWGTVGKWLRKNAIDPLFYTKKIVRWRNKEASYDVRELEPSSREKSTYVLEEYFIPIGNISTFIPKMRAVFQKYHVNVINVSLRHALPDKESYLSWANQEVFAFVVYYKQKTDSKSREEVKQWTQAMTSAILSEKGTWYLPYQPHATLKQFQQGYPNSDRYFALKKRLDPQQRFTNKLLDKYNPNNNNPIARETEAIKGYARAEEQTILTVPEWYLVFNPKEYADYLESGKNPSDFPFYQSIDEYWRLYDRSLKLVSKAYPENKEYKTMLQVIGVSMTMEYGLKMLYENTIGRLFSCFATKQISAEEETIFQAQREYSNFIYQTAWYEFKFLPWVKKVWNVSNHSDSSFFRKWERTLFFTFEFTFKAFYAQVIQWAATASYEAPVTDIYLVVSNDSNLKSSPNYRIVKQEGAKMILAIKRWGIFTEVLKTLAKENIKIYEISGNDEIAVASVGKKSQLPFTEFAPLYESRIVSDSTLIRTVSLVPVSKLLPYLQEAKRNKVLVEHIFDY